MNTKMGYKEIAKKEIVLYGTPEENIAFLEKYSGVFRIRTAVTDLMDEVRLQPYAEWGVETVMLGNAEGTEGKLIVICSEGGFKVFQLRLQFLGKEEYTDYISCALIEHLLYGKELMVCMGTQLLGQVCLLLQNDTAFSDRYSLLYFGESDVLEPYKNRRPEYFHVLHYCSVHVRSACEKERFPMKLPGTAVLPPGCRQITVADYGFGGYFPQVIRNRDRINDYLLRGYWREKMDYETLAFSRMDGEIEKFCKEKVSADAMLERLLDENYFSKEKVQQYFAEETARFTELEKKADIRLSSFIETHKEQYLCRNLNEWQEPMISYVTNCLLAKLNMPELSMEITKREKLLEENGGSEIPVYPSVQKALGLESALRNKKYKMVMYYEVRYMTLEEALRFTIDYMYKAGELLEFTGMDKTLKPMD